MAEHRNTISLRGMQDNEIAQLAGTLAIAANVSVRIDREQELLSIRGDQENVNEVLEIAEEQIAAQQNDRLGQTTRTARRMNRDALNAAPGGQNDIMKNILTTDVRIAAKQAGLQRKAEMLPREHNSDLRVRGNYVLVGEPPIKIFIEVKNLLEANSRIIVNPRNQHLEGGSVSADIEKAAGPDVAKACRELIRKNNGKPFEPGDIHHTRAGELHQFDSIIHTVSLGHETTISNTQMEYLHKTVVNCLQYAEETLEAGSIAMPGIYGGHAGHPPKSVAKAIYDGIIEFSKKEGRGFLKKIFLNDINPTMVEEWKKCFEMKSE